MTSETTALPRLLTALDGSIRELEAHGSAHGATADPVLRPILLRRRRAVAALRALIGGTIRAVDGLRPRRTGPRVPTLEDLRQSESRLLHLYREAIAACVADGPGHRLLRAQRAETEQAHLTLCAIHARA